MFVNLWDGAIGQPLSYATVDKLIERTRRRVGFHFTAHQFRHTYATLAYRDGVALEVIATLLTHRSPRSTLIYTHPTADDLRRALDERGVLDRVADLLRMSEPALQLLDGGDAPRGWEALWDRTSGTERELPHGAAERPGRRRDPALRRPWESVFEVDLEGGAGGCPGAV